jgi:hypothetical protein
MKRGFQPQDVPRVVNQDFMREEEECLRERTAHMPAGVDLAPSSTYEVVTRQMVEALADDIREIKGRLNGLLWMVAGATLIDALIRLSGAGS